MISVHELLRTGQQVNDAIPAKGNNRGAGRQDDAVRLEDWQQAVCMNVLRHTGWRRRRIHRMYVCVSERQSVMG